MVCRPHASRAWAKAEPLEGIPSPPTDYDLLLDIHLPTGSRLCNTAVEPVLKAFIQQAALEEVFHLVFHLAVCKEELAPNDRSTFYSGGFSAQKGAGNLCSQENRTGSLLIHCNSCESSRKMTTLIYTHPMLFQKYNTEFLQTNFSGPSTTISSISLCFLYISSPLTTLCLKPHSNLYCCSSWTLAVFFSEANWHDRIWRSPDFLTATS